MKYMIPTNFYMPVNRQTSDKILEKRSNTFRKTKNKTVKINIRGI